MKSDNEVRDLLESLNYWEQTHGTTYATEPNQKSTGEANARIDDLKQKLKAAGAIFYWNGKEYVLHTVVEPGQGRQLPEEY